MSATESSHAGPRLVVGIGGSLESSSAIGELLRALPADAGMAFLLVVGDEASLDGELLASWAASTPMHVGYATAGTRIAANYVYVIRPDMLFELRGGELEPAKPAVPGMLPFDIVLRSLAQDQGSRAVGVVLSGAGRDGSAGVREVSARGGLTIAQAPSSCGQPEMPRSAVDTGVVDLVLRLAEVPDALRRCVRMPRVVQSEPCELGSEPTSPSGGEPVAGDEPAPSEQPVVVSSSQLASIAAVLEAHSSFDLRVYKTRTVERRVLRRMTLSGFEELGAYIEQLRGDRSEQQLLVRDLLIRVTEFFRDTEAFAAVRELVIAPLVARAEAGTTLRLWVPACATGEEAYSLGMEFLDAITANGNRVNIQIFATDVDEDALAFGRVGVYPPSIAEQIPKHRLQTYFEPLDEHGYQVRPTLRDVVSFATHDLTKDPPFSRMHLVSCRNVLIYLTSAAQRRVLELLHFALEPGGHLFLSTSESTGPQRDLFTAISKRHRVYRKVGVSPPIAVARSRSRPPIEREGAPVSPLRRRSARGGSDLARRSVMQALVPPSVVVSGDGLVVFSHGELSPYLRIPEGDDPRLELAAMLRTEIATRTRSALYKCRRSKELVAVTSSPEAEAGCVRISARPAPMLGDDAVILSFEPCSTTVILARPERHENASANELIEQLERELQATREDLRSTAEELEAASEELRSSSEHSTSMNEELQSANEELEATTEELRSLNEELTTVNAQLREKVEQAEQAHDDLSNFFSSTKVATIFLDERLCIKRFTPAARELLGIERSDIGRFVPDIARELLQNELEREARTVLDHLAPVSRELLTGSGRWIVRHVLPYRTESQRIEGVVVTFTDVSELRAAVEELNVRNRRLELAWEAARGGIFEHRVPLDERTYVSDQWAQVLGYRVEELPPYEQLMAWLTEHAHPDDRRRFEAAYADLLEGRADRYALELRFRHHAGHWIWVRKITRVLERDERGRARHLLRMMIDITDLKHVEESLRESENRFREMTDGLPLIVWVHGVNGEQEQVNQTFCDFYGTSREELSGGRWQMRLHPDDAEGYTREFYTCLQEQRPFHATTRVKHADGSWRWIESWGQPRRSSLGEFLGMVGTSVDITERRRIEDSLRDSEERFRTLADNVSQLAWMANGDGWLFWYNQRWYEYTGTTFEEMQGWGWRSVQHPDHQEQVVAKFRKALAAGEQWEDTFPLRGADGEYRWFLSRAIPIRDESGKVVRWFGTNTDVTHLREVEQRLMQADRQKDEFLAMLGHELRNPLAAIRTASQLLSNHIQSDERLARHQQILERQTSHMATLLDGLLDISRIIRGKIRLEREVLDFTAICREALDDLAGTVGRRRLDLRSEIQAEPLWVDADRVRLAQIVGNLLSNAVKYTPDGGSVQLLLQQHDGMAVLRVRDSGVGIEPALLPHIFEVFRQSEQTIDRSQGGLGLGLALVKTLAELHGGRVQARSEGKDRGAELIVQLPLCAAPSSVRSVGRRDGCASLRVLLIEDNEDAAEMLGEVLQLHGHEVTTRALGKDGLAAARENPPDVVLCDLGLPDGMSGFDVARELRADARTRGIPLVALSGYGRQEDKRRSAEVGFDVHLTKPVDVAQLARLLDEVVGGRGRT